jgi:hypothetical protein
MVQQNSIDHPAYRDALESRAVPDIARWSQEDPLDFFMAAWPKEIAKLALQKSWDIIVHDHAFYDRSNDEGQPYDMVCLVVEFVRTTLCNTYINAVTHCLNQNSRTHIPRFDAGKGVGKSLISDLRAIVALRNDQAKAYDRALLPDPMTEINRLRSEGIPI